MNLSCQIQAVLIPNGKSEGEIWEIFNLVCDQLGEKDEVVLDVTHALRSLPLLAKVVLQYMRVLKDVVLNGIFLQETGISFFRIKADEAASGTHLLDIKKRKMVAGAAVLLVKKEDSSKGRFPEGYEELW